MTNHKQIAKEISEIIPTYLRHMYPYVFTRMKIPPSQILALVSIQERGGCCLKELKEEMHVAAPTISGIISRLERDGYVRRTVDPNDRRIINVVLTGKGEIIVRKFRDNIRRRWEYILSKKKINMRPALDNIRDITKGFTDGTI